MDVFTRFAHSFYQLIKGFCNFVVSGNCKAFVVKVFQVQLNVCYCFQNDFTYVITRGNQHDQFEMVKKHGIWALHFRKRLKQEGTFQLEIDGRPTGTANTNNEVWEKPLQLRVKIVVTQ